MADLGDVKQEIAPTGDHHENGGGGENGENDLKPDVNELMKKIEELGALH